MFVRSRRRVTLLLVLALLLMLGASPAVAKRPGHGHIRVGDIEFIGSTAFDTGYMFDGTEVGGLSGIVYDKWNDEYYALSDDKSEVNDARFYTLSIDLADGTLDDGDVEFTDVTFLRDQGGSVFAPGSLDPEGFEIFSRDRLFIGSERDLNNQPWIKEFGTDGHELFTLPLPYYYLVDGDPQTSGVRTNLAFESLTLTPDTRHLYAATENALVQDGPIATSDEPSPSRVLEYKFNHRKHGFGTDGFGRDGWARTGHEYVYVVDPIPYQEDDTYADNGLAELQALDDSGTFLAMERSYATDIGNTIRLFETSTVGATNVARVEDLDGVSYVPMSKRLVLSLNEGEYEGITLDNMEGMVLGPRMDDGRYPLILVADNNFNSPYQRTLFMVFAVRLVHH